MKGIVIRFYITYERLHKLLDKGSMLTAAKTLTKNEWNGRPKLGIKPETSLVPTWIWISHKRFTSTYKRTKRSMIP